MLCIVWINVFIKAFILKNHFYIDTALEICREDQKKSNEEVKERPSLKLDNAIN